MTPLQLTSILERQGLEYDYDAVWVAPIRELLTAPQGNPKVAKGLKRKVATAILHLTPAEGSGLQVCPAATAGCRAACLNTAGRGGLGGPDNTIQRARRRRTLQYFARRDEFLARLVRELELHESKWRRKGFKPAARLNGTSDIKWENVPVTRSGKRYANIMQAFPRMQFYDYTKRTDRTNLPRNYDLTFSLADGNDSSAEKAFALGWNVAAVVIDDEIRRRSGTRYARLAPLPAVWNGRPTIDGDENDLRYLDPRGVYVLLRAKGRAVNDSTGFVRAA